MDFNSEFEFKLYCFINKCLLSVFCVLLLGTERTNRRVCLLATHRLVGNTNNYHTERCTRRDGSVGWNVQRGSHMEHALAVGICLAGRVFRFLEGLTGSLSNLHLSFEGILSWEEMWVVQSKQTHEWHVWGNTSSLEWMNGYVRRRIRAGAQVPSKSWSVKPVDFALKAVECDWVGAKGSDLNPGWPWGGHDLAGCCSSSDQRGSSDLDGSEEMVCCYLGSYLGWTFILNYRQV